jgi:low affinity Fe/Cu permease
VQDSSGKKSEQRHPGSRVLHVLDRWAARPTLALGAVAAVMAWVLVSAVVGFPARLENVFWTLAAATTLIMVFVIQHTQARAQEATQRKLDEILRASPQADNSLITLEEAPDNELKAATDTLRGVRRDARREERDQPPA